MDITTTLKKGAAFPSRPEGRGFHAVDKMKKTGSVIGGTLLVAGTTIGAGMLALPVRTSLGGFYPSFVVFMAVWLFMASTGLLILEACLWMDGDTNLVSMADHTLGKVGKACSWALYLFLFYTLTVAYVGVCGDLLADFLKGSISDWVGSIIFVIVFGSTVFLGARYVDKLNAWMMLGLGLSFFFFVWKGYPYVKTELLTHRNWLLSWRALPVAFASFGFQSIIPTLVNYMKRDVKKVRKAVLLGSFIPMLAYILWEWLIHGIIPTYGVGGLAEALKNNFTAVRPLRQFITTPFVADVADYFAFFAVTTSFLGVTLGLRDFLADGFKIKKDWRGKALLCSLTYVPPLIFSMLTPRLFIDALDFAGGFGVVMLLGILPVLMVWSGRYRHGFFGKNTSIVMDGECCK